MKTIPLVDFSRLRISARHIAIACSVVLPVLSSPAEGQILADFTDGNTSSLVDGYPGTVGSGWASGWTSNKTSAANVTLTNTASSASPLAGGGNYLSVQVSNASTASDYGGAVTRTFDSAVLDPTTPWDLYFDFRGDSVIPSVTADANSDYAIFGSVSNSAAQLDSNTTWGLAIRTASGTTRWRYYSGSTLIDTGVTYASGTVYRVGVFVDPQAKTYSFMINDGATVYESPTDIPFRNASTGVNKVFFSAKDDKDHTGSVDFSLDHVRIEASSPVLAQGFPEPIVPNINGAALHTNTYIDFASPANDPAMTQYANAGYRFARFGVPWFDVERTAGDYNLTAPQSYIPGYAQLVEMLGNKGIRPIIFVGLGNTVYGTDTTNGGIQTDAQRQGFHDYCRAIAYAFRDYDPIFEIWNEPNLSGFWVPASNVDEYMARVPYAVSGLREGWHLGRESQNLPNPLVIAPGVANSWARGNFIDKCFDRGLLDMVDGVSVHPYSNYSTDPAKRIPEALASPMSLLKTELAARGKPNYPIVLTEWGFSTDRNDYGVSTDTHAKFAVRQILMGYYTGITINCVYSLDDARNVDDNTSDKHYGLFTTSGANFAKTLVAKPAVAKVAALNSTLAGYRYVQKVALGNTAPLNNAKDWCLVFWNPTALDADGTPGNAKAVLWTTETTDLTGPYQVALDFRGDSAIPAVSADTNSNYCIFGSLVENASTLDANTTWGLGATYSGGALQWRYYNGATLTSTGVTFVPGTVYHIVVNVNPASSTYSFTITGGAASYTSPTGIPFRAAGPGQNRVFFGARDDKDHPGAMTFSVDNLALQLSGGSTTPPAGPLANFSDGATNAATDGFPGMAGSHWLTGWAQNSGSAANIQVTTAITTTNAINSGGSYLQVNVSNSSTASDYAGAIARSFDTILGVQKTSPDLKPLLGLDTSVTTPFTDDPVVVDLDGYTAP